MRAAVLRAVGAPILIEEVELALLRATEVRVRVNAAGVCDPSRDVLAVVQPKG